MLKTTVKININKNTLKMFLNFLKFVSNNYIFANDFKLENKYINKL